MNYIVADEELESHLRGFLEPIEIRDSKGNVLGHYAPQVTPEELARYEKLSELFDLEEAERALASGGNGRSLTEIKQYLHSLEK